MYRPTKPRALDQPATILIRPAITGARASVELICCTNLRRSEDTVSCGKRGGREVARALRKGIRTRGLDASVVTSGCLGSCARVADTSIMLDALERIIVEQQVVDQHDG